MSAAEPVERPPIQFRMRTADIVVGIGVAVLGGIVWWGARGLVDLRRPQAGAEFMPTIVGIGLLACGALLTFNAWRRTGDRRMVEVPQLDEMGRVLLTLGLLVAFALTMDTLGFVVASFALVFISVAVLSRKSVLMALLLAVVIPLVTYILFHGLLQMRLPVGIWAP